MSNNFRRLKNGVTFYGVYSYSSKHGDAHSGASMVEFPNGTKVRGYRDDFDVLDDDGGAQILAGSIETLDDRRKVGAKITADSITYPNGSKIENPSAAEIDALFPKEGTEIAVNIGATIRIGTFGSEGNWYWKSLEPDSSLGGKRELYTTEDAAFEGAMSLVSQATDEMDWGIDTVIHVRASGAFATVSVASWRPPLEPAGRCIKEFIADPAMPF
jgi:hypothetical protein